MRTVVAATDFSTRSATALDRAESLARDAGARLVIVHAVDDDLPRSVIDHMVQEADELLAAEAAHRGQGLEVGSRVVLGDVFLALRSAAVEAAAELLVVGDHRRSRLRDAFRDTTVERLIRVAPCPVLVSRLRGAGSYRHALLGIESGEEAPELFEAVAALGQGGPARVTALHAFEAIGSGLMLFAGSTQAEVARYEDEKAATLREALWERLSPLSDRPTDLRVVEGEASRAIEATVAANDCDLVVVSTHARRALARSLLGSVSAHLIRHGSTDVLVVPRAAGGRAVV